MITYKDITEVEVLEQASENTMVLVNEEGELMQAPYSNFENKMADAEMLDEIPETATALINDGGVLKQVNCSKFGGGIATAIIKQDGYNDALSGTVIPTETFTCINMTFNEAVQIIMSGEPLSAVGMHFFEEGVSFLNYDNISYSTSYYPSPTIVFGILSTNNLNLYWTANGITNKDPSLPPM